MCWGKKNFWKARLWELLSPRLWRRRRMAWRDFQRSESRDDWENWASFGAYPNYLQHAMGSLETPGKLALMISEFCSYWNSVILSFFVGRTKEGASQEPPGIGSQKVTAPLIGHILLSLFAFVFENALLKSSLVFSLFFSLNSNTKIHFNLNKI